MHLKVWQQALQHIHQNQCGTQYEDGPMPNLSVLADIVHTASIHANSVKGSTNGDWLQLQAFMPSRPFLEALTWLDN